MSASIIEEVEAATAGIHIIPEYALIIQCSWLSGQGKRIGLSSWTLTKVRDGVFLLKNG